MEKFENFKAIKINAKMVSGGASEVVGSTYNEDRATEIDNPDCSDGCDNDIDRGTYQDITGKRISGCVFHEC